MLLSGEEDSSRTQALSVLASSGRLPELIERAKAELKRSPSSVTIHQTLADYYAAARQPGAARDELKKLADLRPDDVDLRIQVASQLARENQPDVALAHFKAAFQKDPSLAGRHFTQVHNMLIQAGKYSEMLDFFDTVDLRYVGTPTYVARVIEDLPADPKLTERLQAAFRKAWQTFPDDHFYFVTVVRRAEIWQMPEMYELAHEAILPRTQGFVNGLAAWYPFMRALTVRNAVSVVATTVNVSMHESALVRFINLAESQGRLAQLTAEVEAARKAVPAWTAGDAILAILYSRAGKERELGLLLPKMCDELDKDTYASAVAYGFYAYWAVGEELERNSATRHLAEGVYARSLAAPFSLLQFRMPTTEVPLRRLVRPLRARRAPRASARRDPQTGAFAELPADLCRRHDQVGPPRAASQPRA